jgi:hypothetical protein
MGKNPQTAKTPPAAKTAAKAPKQAAKARASAETSSRAPTEAEVKERAHLIWVQEGKPEGREVDHWMRARRELERDAGLD